MISTADDPGEQQATVLRLADSRLKHPPRGGNALANSGLVSITNQPAGLIHVLDFITAMQAARLSNRTITERARVLRQFARQAEIQPAHAATADIAGWMASRDDLSDWTIASYYVHLRQFFKWMQIMDLRADNPMIRIKAPRIPNDEPPTMSTAQLVALLHTRMHRRTFVMIMLGAFQGMRVSEIARVKGEDFSLDRNRVRIVGKGRKTRSMPMHPLIRDLAAEMPARGWWFPSHVLAGQHVRGKSVSTMIAEAIKRAEFVGRPHGLRHWHATTMLENGVDIRVIQVAMRHETIATTMRYTRVPDQMVADAITGLRHRKAA